MKLVLGFLKSVFNFFVGDWIILGGVGVTLLVVALIENLSALEVLRPVGGYLLILGCALSLVITLRRETSG